MNKRPAGEVNLTIRNASIRIEDDNTVIVDYDLFYANRHENWVMPSDSKALDNCAEQFEKILTGEETDWAVWTTNRGTRRRPDYEWDYMVPMSEYAPTPKMTNIAKSIKLKKLESEFTTTQITQKQIFDQLFSIAKDN